jgi:hypothetical protein
MDFNFSSELTVEGLATAIGVLGAAIGYLINLFRNWRNERLDARYRGTKLMILDLLERNFWYGLSEEELWTLYRGNSTSERRSHYKAWPPSKFNRLDFEREIRQLQLDHLIELAEKDTYRLRAYPVSLYDLEKATEIANANLLAAKVNRTKLTEVAKRVLVESERDHEKLNAARLLVKVADSDSLGEVLKLLDSSDTEVALEAAEFLLPYMFAQKPPKRPEHSLPASKVSRSGQQTR